MHRGTAYTALPHERVQPALSTRAGVEARRVPASSGSLVATLPAVLADLSGSLGGKVRRNLPESELANGIWEGVRGLRDYGEVTEENMGQVVPRAWIDKAFHPDEVYAHP